MGFPNALSPPRGANGIMGNNDGSQVSGASGRTLISASSVNSCRALHRVPPRQREDEASLLLPGDQCVVTLQVLFEPGIVIEPPKRRAGKEQELGPPRAESFQAAAGPGAIGGAGVRL